MNQEVAGSRRPAQESTGDLVLPAHEPQLLSTAERLEALLARAPRGSPSNLSPEFEAMFIAEQEWLTRFCLAHPRLPGYGRFISEVLGDTLRNRSDVTRGCAWELLPFNDAVRMGTDRRVIFGQVKWDEETPSFFVGSALARNGVGDRQFTFQISAAGRVLAVQPLVDGMPEHAAAIRAELIKRHPAPWTLQVDRGCALGKWVDDLYAGSDAAKQQEVRLGQHTGEISLGVIGEAVRDALKESHSHYYLPRARRRGSREPWHTGAFMRYEERGFVWESFALNRTGQPELVRVRVDCSVNSFQFKGQELVTK